MFLIYQYFWLMEDTSITVHVTMLKKTTLQYAAESASLWMTREFRTTGTQITRTVRWKATCRLFLLRPPAQLRYKLQVEPALKKKWLSQVLETFNH